MDIVTIIISGIIGIAAGFGIAKIIEKSNISNLIKNIKNSSLKNKPTQLYASCYEIITKDKGSKKATYVSA